MNNYEQLTMAVGNPVSKCTKSAIVLKGVFQLKLLTLDFIIMLRCENKFYVHRGSCNFVQLDVEQQKSIDVR